MIDRHKGKVHWPLAVSLACFFSICALAALAFSTWPMRGERIDSESRPIASKVQEMLNRGAHRWDTAHMAADVPFTFIRLERHGCYGDCPVYSVTFHRDGSAELVAKHNMDIEGTFTAHIEPYQYARLAQLVDLARNDMLEPWHSGPIDSEEVAITVGIEDGKVEAAGSSWNMPPNLWSLIQVLDAQQIKTQWSKT